MKMTVVYALFFSCFSLQAMINKDLKEELSQAAKKDDYFDQADKCYEAICTYVMNSKIQNYKRYCDLLKKECNEEILKYMPSITEYNVSMIKHRQMTEKFQKTLKIHLKDAKKFYAQKQENELVHLKNRHLCNEILFGLVGLASGFLIGVYEYGVC